MTGTVSDDAFARAAALLAGSAERIDEWAAIRRDHPERWADMERQIERVAAHLSA